MILAVLLALVVFGMFGFLVVWNVFIVRDAAHKIAGPAAARAKANKLDNVVKGILELCYKNQKDGKIFFSDEANDKLRSFYEGQCDFNECKKYMDEIHSFRAFPAFDWVTEWNEPDKQRLSNLLMQYARFKK